MTKKNDWDKALENETLWEDIMDATKERVSFMDLLDLWSAPQIRSLKKFHDTPEDKIRYAFIMLSSSAVSSTPAKTTDTLADIAFDELYDVPLRVLAKEMSFYLQTECGIIKEIITNKEVNGGKRI